MHKWFYETGIGENRAILVEDSQISEIAIERSFGIFSGPKYGAISKAKLQKKYNGGGFILLDDDSEAIIKKWPLGYTEGQSLNVEIIRERLFERTREKLPVAIATDREVQDAPTLWERIQSSQTPIQKCAPYEGDIFAQYGWYEALEQAEQGLFPFKNGRLIIDECAAMTMIDVDGDADNFTLAKVAALECAKAIRLYNLQSMVGVDFPALESKEQRTKASDILDRNMTRPCERTAINGFGFMQIVMKCIGPSLIEYLRYNHAANIALMALRRAELEAAQSPLSQMKISAHPDIIALLTRYDWMDILSKRTARNWQLVEKEYDDIVQFDII